MATQHTIAKQFQHCVDSFTTLRNVLYAGDKWQSKDPQILSDLLDEEGRLKAWAGDTGVNRKSEENSLDELLPQISEIRVRVMKLLEDLNTELKEGGSNSLGTPHKHVVQLIQYSSNLYC